MTIDSTFKEASLKGAWVHKPKSYLDNRGSTIEIYNVNQVPTGFANLSITQILESESSYGVIRGIHYSSINNIQTKIVRCLHGTIRDIAIDLRPDSDTFGKYEVFELSSENRMSLFMSQGFGHSYQVLSASATVLYALQTNFDFSEEFAINPLDTELALPWEDIPPILSLKDANAPTYKEAMRNRS